jgi:hypothetical protein
MSLGVVSASEQNMQPQLLLLQNWAWHLAEAQYDCLQAPDSNTKVLVNSTEASGEAAVARCALH